MEQVLRKKFIYISVGVVFVVLCTIAIIINGASYYQINYTADQILDLLSENGGRFPMDYSYHQRQLPQETEFSTRYFLVMLDDSGSLVAIDTRNVQATSSEQAAEYGMEVWESGKNTGFLDFYRYRTVETDYGTLIIFLDREQELQLLQSTIISSIFICVVALIAVWLLVVILSKKAVQPIADSYRKQQQFITNITHELKTPLAIMKTNTEVIELESGTSQWCNSIHHQIERLNGLVNYLVSLSKMDEDGSRLIKTDFSLSDAVEDSVENFTLLAQGAGKNLSADIAPNLSYHGEEQSIRLLLSILLDNAIKYSSESATIHMGLKNVKSGQRGKMRLTVANQADNLSPQNYDILFERFYRMDDSRNSQTGGFGIGLAIAHTIVRNHGGDIHAESPDGEKLVLSVEF